MGKKFRDARKKLGLTVGQLGAALGVSGATISRFERGLGDLPLHVAMKAARMLGLTLGGK